MQNALINLQAENIALHKKGALDLEYYYRDLSRKYNAQRPK